MNELGQQQADRLFSSWKEISAFLNRGVRTVQRWEHCGLPIRRPIGAGKNVVFAVESELQRWCSTRHDNPKLARAHTCSETVEWRSYAVRLSAVRQQLGDINARLTKLEVRLQKLLPSTVLQRAS